MSDPREDDAMAAAFGEERDETPRRPAAPDEGEDRPGTPSEAAQDPATPRTTPPRPGRRPLLALGALLPLAVAAGALVELPPAAREDAARASTTALPGPLQLHLPGPVQVPDAVTDSGSDADLAVTPPATEVAVGALALETDSSLLFGRTSGTTTRQDDEGRPAAPSLTLEDADGAEISATATAGELGATVLAGTGVTVASTLAAATSAGDRPVADAVQSTLTPSGDYRGLVLTRALPARPDGAFLGLTTVAGSSAALVLRNPSARPATAALQAWTTEGPAAMAGRSQVVVGPGETQTVLLESIVPDQEALALQVQVQGSPLAMHVQLSERDGLTPGGVEILTPLEPAASSRVLAGVQVAAVPPLLVLANADARATTAQVSVLGPDGVIDEGSPGEVELTGEAVTSLELGSLPDGAVTVLVSSPSSLRAAVRCPVAGADLAGSTVGAPVDLAVVGPAPELPVSGVVALPAGGGHGWLTLAATTATSCTIIPVAADGTAAEPIVRELPEQGSVVVADPSLRIGDQQPSGLVIVPDLPGAVHAAWLQREQDGAGGVLHSGVPVVATAATGEGTTITLAG